MENVTPGRSPAAAKTQGGLQGPRGGSLQSAGGVGALPTLRSAGCFG